MKKRQHILLALLFLAMAVKAQERPYLQGVCVNEKGRAIQNVGVYVHDTVLMWVTDDNGHIVVARATEGQQLRFAHFVYEARDYTIRQKE